MDSRALGTQAAELVEPVQQFLRCATPVAWSEAACKHLDVLLLDHATLELKAAQQAQKLIWRYGTGAVPAAPLSSALRQRLVHEMSRLAREELRHFEQVQDLLTARGLEYRSLSPSRYARELHAQVRTVEPGRLIDTLLVGAIIEARSCERFYALLTMLGAHEADLMRFYASLLRSEARHFESYLTLARHVADGDPGAELEAFLSLDESLITADDRELRFHSGPPGPAGSA